MASVLETKEGPTLGATVSTCAGVLCSDKFPTGDRAKLRRMVPGESPPGVFYRFAFRHLPEGWEQAQREWMTILAGMAIMVPAANSRGNPAGKMLGESGYSESRLERLLSAEGDVLETLVLRVARFAAAKAQPIDWTQLAQLLLAKNPERADAIRMRIAKDYYRAIR